MIMNEKIKASELLLTGIDGENLGIVSRAEALAMAKELKADLVCESLMSSPPPCKLMRRGSAKQEASQQKREAKLKEQPAKVKELRLTVDIEQHDYETKQRQAAKLLEAGHAVLLVVKVQGKEGAKAKELLEQLSSDLASCGKKATGIQVSGKQAAVQLNPS
ncbi:translation initiation factor IF-3 [Paenibacillus sp. NEAU-GSW1]|uniref:translation initiation factor IF-3 n=1 Tax=Paenibacillus sp. NEAU-GSW1 TaxID=2682486 RepID=UPI0012E0EBDC|nr:translation initiation factor IF-3 [Paenibacillus sp. NEAU-GSW1]MUT66081.1 translation initiation factor IF-3 [Paenibacillus sp. NEAU-GSW1]